MSSDAPPPAAFLQAALPTTATATALFDEVCRLLADRAVVQSGGAGRSRALYVRARGGDAAVVPWPLLTLCLADPSPFDAAQASPSTILELPRDATGRLQPLPMTFHPVPGSIAVCDGPLALSVEYDPSGRKRCGVGPAEFDAFVALAEVLGGDVEGRLSRLAHHIAAIDLGRHGPARVVAPRPLPQGIEGVWKRGRAAIRAAMNARRVPTGSFWAVADGYVGQALAFGARREEAIAAWRREVERLRPAPPPPVEVADFLPSPPSELPNPEASYDPSATDHEPTGMRFIVTGWDAPSLDPSMAAVPFAVVRVASLPAAPPPQGSWTRWLGDHGGTHFAVRVPNARGFTLVGEALLRHVDLTSLDRRLDALDAAFPRLSAGEGEAFALRGVPRPTHATVYYRCVDAATGLPIEPRIEAKQFASHVALDALDGSRFRTHIVRVVELDAT